MHHLILKQPISCGESRPSPPNHLLGSGSLGLSVTKKGTLTGSNAFCASVLGYMYCIPSSSQVLDLDVSEFCYCSYTHF